MEFTFDVAHILPIIAAVVGGLFVLKLVKGLIKWAMIAGLVAAALLYFNVI